MATWAEKPPRALQVPSPLDSSMCLCLPGRIFSSISLTQSKCRVFLFPLFHVTLPSSCGKFSHRAVINPSGWNPRGFCLFSSRLVETDGSLCPNSGDFLCPSHPAGALLHRKSLCTSPRWPWKTPDLCTTVLGTNNIQVSRLQVNSTGTEQFSPASPEAWFLYPASTPSPPHPTQRRVSWFPGIESTRDVHPKVARRQPCAGTQVLSTWSTFTLCQERSEAQMAGWCGG